MIVPPAPTVIEIGFNVRPQRRHAGHDVDQRRCAGVLPVSVSLTKRRCHVQRTTANVICLQIAGCAASSSEPEYQSPKRHRHYPHSA
jgi:hypothetical protein